MASVNRTLQFPSVLENIHIAEQLIDDVCAEFHVKEDYYGELLIAMTEAVNNAIVHGNKMDPSKSVTLHFTVSENNLRFTIEDEGPGFDYDNLPDPTAPMQIEQPNGRGVFLMRQLSDYVYYYDNGRKVEIQFTLR